MQPISVNKQSSIRLEGSKVLYFDPLEVKTRHDADYIFITHPHFDHFSLLSILELKKEGTVIITTKDIVEELLSVGFDEEYIMVVKPNKTYSLKNIEFSRKQEIIIETIFGEECLVELPLRLFYDI